MSVNLQRDIGAFIAGAFGMAATTITSDTTQENDGQFGVTIDRLTQARRYLSVKLYAATLAVLGSSTGGVGRSATVSAFLQDSADGNTWADYATDYTPPALVVGGEASSASSTGTPTAGVGRCAVANYDLSRARRYIRSKVLADLSATSSAGKTAAIAVVLGFGGADAVLAT